MEGISAHFKFIESLLLVALNTFDKAKLEAVAEEEQKSSKKKKKGKQLNPFTNYSAIIKSFETSITNLGNV